MEFLEASSFFFFPEKEKKLFFCETVIEAKTSEETLEYRVLQS